MPELNERIIKPRPGLLWLDLPELWRYRELFVFLTLRDVLIRYKQTAIGILWVVLQPFLTMIVFTVIFGRLAKMPSGGAPYAVLTFAALLPWQYIPKTCGLIYFRPTEKNLRISSEISRSILYPYTLIRSLLFSSLGKQQSGLAVFYGRSNNPRKNSCF